MHLRPTVSFSFIGRNAFGHTTTTTTTKNKIYM